jgi:two-component system cell cycle sensor histidine kinase/response regulator CckA
MRRKDGTVFPTERSVVPLEDRQGNRTGWVSVVRDITERKRAENEKQELQSQLAQSQKMEALGILAGGMAHEFNNINADVITYIDLALETGDLPISVRRKLEVARSSAVRGAEFTRSLLTFSKRDVGEKQPVSLPEIVDEILTITESELVAEGIELFVKHPPKLPPVMGNPGLLIQVVMNLVLNAKHAMLQSPVKKLAICTGLEKNGAFISVKDSGCGIPEKDIPRLWEPFFTTKRAPRNSQGHDRKMEGTGLGLSVSHSIIESHGGRIIVKSEPGKGATFKVYLPPAQFDTPIRRETRPGTSRPTMIIPTA